MNWNVLFFWQSDKETEKIMSSVNGRVISEAYKSLASEINSLRLYDRGEKEIDAPDIKVSLRNIQRTV